MVEMIDTLINGRWNIKLPKHRAERAEWHTEEGWERARLDSMFRELVLNKDYDDPQDVMFYIGAEEGDMAGLLSSWGVRVGMFEPNIRVWPNIKAIWDTNNLEKPLFCFAGFASNKVSSNAFEYMKIEDFPEWANGEVIGDHGFKELIDPGEISQIKIDEVPFLPSALSIDVEGSEWEVLKGAEQTLRKLHPKIWLSVHPEFMFRIYGEYQADLRRWIKDLGYKETILDYQHELHLYYEAA